MNNMNFFKDKKILVTGGTGFIGSHLVDRLVSLGSIIYVPTRNKEFQLDNKRINIMRGDLNNLNFCNEITKDIDIVFNLAADVKSIHYKTQHPASCFRDNLTIFMNILESSRINKVKKFLTMSSVSVYPSECKIPIPEEEGIISTPNPNQESYGWAKRMQEFLSISYSKEYNMNISIIRADNVYGPKDNFNNDSVHVIPTLIRKIISNENPINVWGSGNQTRSFIYIDDLIDGLNLAIEKINNGDPINIGSEEEISIKELVETIMNLSNKKPQIIFDKTKAEGHKRRVCDISKAKKILGFKAKTNIKEGLNKTIEWYKNENIFSSRNCI